MDKITIIDNLCHSKTCDNCIKDKSLQCPYPYDKEANTCEKWEKRSYKLRISETDRSSYL